MNIELNNIRWFKIDDIRCIGFSDEFIILPDKDCRLAVVISKEQYIFGRLEKISEDKLVFNYNKQGEVI